MRIRFPWLWLSHVIAECDPFCALQARWAVSRSRPPLRLLRIGEHDEKLKKLHHLALSAALNVLAPERADFTATACMECLPGMFNDYGILESVSCQLGFFSDGVEPKMCQQRALGSCGRLTSLRASRDCPDFPGVAECRVHSAQIPRWALIKCLCRVPSAPTHGWLERHRQRQASKVRFLLHLVSV